MNTNRIIFLRHADTKKDPNLHAMLWGLSEEGAQQAKKVSEIIDFQNIDIIYTSEEQKTLLTVELLAQKLHKTIHKDASFNEVERGEKFLTKEEFEVEKKKQLEDLNFHAFGGESGTQALERFKKGVEKVCAENSDKTILICTHGTILNIYFADLMQDFQNLRDRWSNTAFCAYGIVENRKVTRDITQNPFL